jgi:uncharacterized protein YbbK (DUF523 family)
MQFVLVSACLLGEPVRYDGGGKRCDNEILRDWMREGRVVAICPEVAGGLPIPRLPAEISNGLGGALVLAGLARVVDAKAQDVSGPFIKGAEQALKEARTKGISIAILKEGSPSCGTAFIYDGSFTGKRVANIGVTAALLQQAGIHVFSEDQFREANNLLMSLEAENA